MADEIIDLLIETRTDPASLNKARGDVQKGFSNIPISTDNKSVRQEAQKTAKELNKQGNAASASLSGYDKDVKKTTAAQKKLNTSVRQGGQAFDNFAERTGFSANRLAAYILPATAFFNAFRGINFITTGVIDLNKNLVRLDQVFSKNGGNAKEVSAEILETAANLGQSGREIQDLATNIAQSGLTSSTKEFSNLVEVLTRSSLAPTFGSIEETFEGGLAFINQFNLGLSSMLPTLDSANSLAKEFSVSSADIFKAVETGGSAFAEFDGSVNNFQAIVTTIRQLTRLSASTIGTGLNTIVLRTFRKENREKIEGLGVSTEDEAGNLRGFVDVMKDVAVVYKDLDGAAQQGLIESLFGIRQGKIGISLLKDLGRANSVFKDALQTADGSSGSIYEDSIKGLRRLDVQFQQIGSTIEQALGELAGDQNLIKFVTNISDALQVLAKTALFITPVLSELFKITTLVGTAFAIKSTSSFAKGLGLSGVGRFDSVRGSKGGEDLIGPNVGGFFGNKNGSSPKRTKVDISALKETNRKNEIKKSLDDDINQKSVIEGLTRRKNQSIIKKDKAQSDIKANRNKKLNFSDEDILNIARERAINTNSFNPLVTASNNLIDAENKLIKFDSNIEDITESFGKDQDLNSTLKGLNQRKQGLKKSIQGYTNAIVNMDKNYVQTQAEKIRQAIGAERLRLRTTTNLSDDIISESVFNESIDADVRKRLSRKARKRIIDGGLPTQQELEDAFTENEISKNAFKRGADEQELKRVQEEIKPLAKIRNERTDIEKEIKNLENKQKRAIDVERLLVESNARSKSNQANNKRLERIRAYQINIEKRIAESKDKLLENEKQRNRISRKQTLEDRRQGLLALRRRNGVSKFAQKVGSVAFPTIFTGPGVDPPIFGGRQNFEQSRRNKRRQSIARLGRTGGFAGAAVASIGISSLVNSEGFRNYAFGEEVDPVNKSINGDVTISDDYLRRNTNRNRAANFFGSVVSTAITGASIGAVGGALGGGVLSIPGALIGGAVGGVVGGATSLTKSFLGSRTEQDAIFNRAVNSAGELSNKVELFSQGFGEELRKVGTKFNLNRDGTIAIKGRGSRTVIQKYEDEKKRIDAITENLSSTDAGRNLKQSVILKTRREVVNAYTNLGDTDKVDGGSQYRTEVRNILDELAISSDLSGNALKDFNIVLDGLYESIVNEGIKAIVKLDNAIKKLDDTGLEKLQQQLSIRSERLNTSNQFSSFRLNIASTDFSSEKGFNLQQNPFIIQEKLRERLTSGNIEGTNFESIPGIENLVKQLSSIRLNNPSESLKTIRQFVNDGDIENAEQGANVLAANISGITKKQSLELSKAIISGAILTQDQLVRFITASTPAFNDAVNFTKPITEQTNLRLQKQQRFLSQRSGIFDLQQQGLAIQQEDINSSERRSRVLNFDPEQLINNALSIDTSSASNRVSNLSQEESDLRIEQNQIGRELQNGVGIDRQEELLQRNEDVAFRLASVQEQRIDAERRLGEQTAKLNEAFQEATKRYNATISDIGGRSNISFEQSQGNARNISDFLNTNSFIGISEILNRDGVKGGNLSDILSDGSFEELSKLAFNLGNNVQSNDFINALRTQSGETFVGDTGSTGNELANILQQLVGLNFGASFNARKNINDNIIQLRRREGQLSQADGKLEEAGRTQLDVIQGNIDVQKELLEFLRRNDVGNDVAEQAIETQGFDTESLKQSFNSLEEKISELINSKSEVTVNGEVEVSGLDNINAKDDLGRLAVAATFRGLANSVSTDEQFKGLTDDILEVVNSYEASLGVSA